MDYWFSISNLCWHKWKWVTGFRVLHTDMKLIYYCKKCKKQLTVSVNGSRSIYKVHEMSIGVKDEING